MIQKSVLSIKERVSLEFLVLEVRLLLEKI